MAEKKTTTSTTKKTEVKEDKVDLILKRLEALEKENTELKKTKEASNPNIIQVVEPVKKSSKFKSPLLNKKVTIALIESPPNTLHRDKDQATLLNGASKSFTIPMNQYGQLVDPLEDWEREYLEDRLGINLSINVVNTKDNPHANFWTSKRALIELRKTSRRTESASIVFDLNDPYQFILWKIAKVSPRVANSWGERFNKPGEYEFVIKDGEVEYVEELTKTEKEAEVIAYLLQHKKSKKKLFDLIRLYGIENVANQIKYTSDTEFMFNELWKVIKRPSEINKLHEVIHLGEKDVETKVFLADAVTVGLMEKRGWEYRLVGGDRIGANQEEAIAFLEDPLNQSTKVRIQIAIENFYNKK